MPRDRNAEGAVHRQRPCSALLGQELGLLPPVSMELPKPDPPDAHHHVHGVIALPLITRPVPRPQAWLITCLAFHTLEAVLQNCRPFNAPPHPREMWQTFPGLPPAWGVSGLNLCGFCTLQ